MLLFESSELLMDDENYPTNVYGKRIVWEIPVQLCMKDFLKKGMTAFDVGANIGAITIAMARIVGNNGKIHSFEANPFLIPRIKNDLEANKISNVTLVPKAVWSKSLEKISFYCENSFYAAGSSMFILNQNSKKIDVEAISIDDYCLQNKTNPEVIKIDVEGAEFHVLKGAEQTIKKNYPIIVFEYIPSGYLEEEDPAQYLNSLGYKLFDTNLYSEVSRQFYLSHYKDLGAVNILAIPAQKFEKSPYHNISNILQETINFGNGKLKSESIHLKHAGRYRIVFEFDGPSEIIAGLIVSNIDGELLGFYETQIFHLKQHSCSNIIIEIDKPTDIICQITSKELSEIILKKIDIFKINFNQTIL